MEKYLAEDKQVKAVIGPVDLNTGANTGNRVNIANAKKVTFIINVGAGTSSSAHSVVLKQHTAASAGTSADLSSDNPYFHKVNAATSFTKVSLDAAAATYDLHSLLADYVGIVIFEVRAEQLTDGYGWVSLDIGDVGGAQLGGVIALVDCEFKPAYDKVV